MGDNTKIRYSEEIAAKICELLAGGMSVNRMCAERDDLPDKSTVFVWLSRHPDFADKYARAREAWADAEFDNLIHLADTPVIGEKTTTKEIKGVEVMEVTTGDCVDRARLQIDARKWALARMQPRKYGDRIAQEITNPDGSLSRPMSNAEIARQLNMLAAKTPPAESDDGSDLV